MIFFYPLLVRELFFLISCIFQKKVVPLQADCARARQRV